MSGIFVVLEETKGRIGRISWEALAAAEILARQTGAKVNAIVIGSQTEPLAVEAAKRVSGRLLRIEHPLLTRYTADGFSLALEQFIQAESPDYLVFPHTYQVRDFVPALAARLGRVLIGDVIGIEDGPIFTRQLMQGRLSGNYRPASAGPCFV
jgi:electron transfer flavoprotein alpha subunit